MKMKRYIFYLAVMMVMALFIWLSLIAYAKEEEEDIYRDRRDRMVQTQIMARGVKDEAVLLAMGTVPRHRFVSEDLVGSAYKDRPLPLGSGQTISQPYIVALMSELSNVRRGSKVLEVGTGSGYQAAIIAQRGVEVYTIEIFEELGTSAQKRLKDLGYSRVKVRVADGYYGWPGEAPFDAIIVTCAASHIPPPLIEQLGEGGRMCIPVGSVFWTQNLMLVYEKEGEIITENILPVRFVPLLGEH